MPYSIQNRRRPIEKLREEFPDAYMIDMTAKANKPWVRFSPMYPHGGIPIPFSPRRTSWSVEGIWQGLKVFEKSKVDPSSFDNQTMAGMKRTTRKFGDLKGIQYGLDSDELIDVVRARREIYLPSYKFVLENRMKTELEALKRMAEDDLVVLLDYELNGDIENTKKPLSHASLVVAWLEDNWPG